MHTAWMKPGTLFAMGMLIVCAAGPTMAQQEKSRFHDEVLKELGSINRRLNELEREIQTCRSPLTVDTITFFYTFSVINANPESRITVRLVRGSTIVDSLEIVGSTPRSALTSSPVAFPVREDDLATYLVASSSSVSASMIIDYNRVLIFHITVSADGNHIELVQE